MIKRSLISILFLLFVLNVFGQQSKALKITLEGLEGNTQIQVSWEIQGGATIVFEKMEIFCSWLAPNFDFVEIASINNPGYDFIITPPFQLTDFEPRFKIKAYTADPALYSSDTVNFIYINKLTDIYSDRYPYIGCKTFPLDSRDTLLLYRKCHFDSEFIKIDPLVESWNSFIDTTLAGVCGDTVCYFITNKDSTSISAKKSEVYFETNKPDKPIVRGLTVDDNDNLVITWHHSKASDVEFYRIDTINHMGSWYHRVDMSADSTSYILMTDFCNYNSPFPAQYQVSAIDSCGMSSDLNMDELGFSPLLLNTPYVYECNSVHFSWNDVKCINGDIDHYFIILYDENEQVEKKIIIKKNEWSTEDDIINYFANINVFNSETLYTARLYAVNNQKPADTVRTCLQSFYIGMLPVAPDTLTILNIKYDTENQVNNIHLYVDPDPEPGVEYILYTSPRNTSKGIKADTLAVIPSEEYPLPLENENLIIADYKEVDDAYMYYLVAKNECSTSFVDSAMMQSIYLMGEEFPDEKMFRLCFSQNINNYDDCESITYTIKRSYYKSNTDNLIEEEIDWINCSTSASGSSSFNSYCDIKSPYEVYNFCDYDMKSYYKDDIYSITWYIEAEIRYNNGDIQFSTSNPLTLYADIIRMPNAFIPNAKNFINSRFGPTNFSPESSYDIQSIEFQIFNSWGERVWYGTDILSEFYWEGKTNKNQDAPAGVYIYIYSITMKDGKQLSTKGTVNLIRH